MTMHLRDAAVCQSLTEVSIQKKRFQRDRKHTHVVEVIIILTREKKQGSAQTHKDD
jgi:hypothetical protein